MKPLIPLLPKFLRSGDSWRSKPFRAMLGNTYWTVATNDRICLAIRGNHADPPSGDPPLYLLDRTLSAPLAVSIEVETSVLREWAGPSPDETIIGESVPLTCAGVLYEHVFDRRNIAYLFSVLPFTKVLMWDATPVIEVPSVGFGEAKDRWRAYVSGTRINPDTVTVRFQPDEGMSAEQRAFELAMSLPDDESQGADW
jgi:hypothetical protein